jgi:hypothetical protein
MKVYGRVKVKMFSLLTSYLGGDKWSASYTGRFTHVKISLLVRGWMGIKSQSEHGADENNFCPTGNLIQFFQPLSLSLIAEVFPGKENGREQSRASGYQNVYEISYHLKRT